MSQEINFLAVVAIEPRVDEHIDFSLANKLALPLARGGLGGVVQCIKTQTHKFQTFVYYHCYVNNSVFLGT